jgi:menaquinone-dependent protoporphyrinogen oxidase
MKTLLVYATKHGCTEKCAALLKDEMSDEITLLDLKKKRPDDLKEFDAVIIGGSIHIGKIQKRIKSFIKENIGTLKAKKLGLFICCMEEGDTAQKEFNEAFPQDLIAQASAKGIFGGEFNFDKMNPIERKMIKKIAGKEENVSKIKQDAITKFAIEFQKS